MRLHQQRAHKNSPRTKLPVARKSTQRRSCSHRFYSLKWATVTDYVWRAGCRSTSDCNDPVNVRRPSRIARLEAHLRDRAVSRCDDVGTPADLGYPSMCPVPCDTIQIDTFFDVGECASCLANNSAIRMAREALGAPQPSIGPSTERRCLRSINRALAFGTRRRMREQSVCQAIQDVGRDSKGIDSVTDCEWADVDGKVTNAEQRARALIARCGPDTLANLDSCHADQVPAVQGCVENSVRRSVGELYEFVYPSRQGLTPLQAFVTSETFVGYDLGGVSGADQICQDAALAAGLTGTWSAWISAHDDGTPVSSPSTTFANNGEAYERIHGTVIAAGFGDLTDGMLDAPINVDELGQTITTDLAVWTGTYDDGTAYDPDSDSGGENCTQWLDDGGEGGRGGLADSTTSNWTDDFDYECQEAHRLYCFEQSN